MCAGGFLGGRIEASNIENEVWVTWQWGAISGSHCYLQLKMVTRMICFSNGTETKLHMKYSDPFSVRLLLSSLQCTFYPQSIHSLPVVLPICRLACQTVTWLLWVWVIPFLYLLVSFLFQWQTEKRLWLALNVTSKQWLFSQCDFSVASDFLHYPQDGWSWCYQYCSMLQFRISHSD